MATHLLNALTFRHDEEAAQRTLQYFWNTQSLFDSDLVEEHISSQPLLAASIFLLIFSSITLFIFAIIFTICRLKGQCGAQKYQEYPTNSGNYTFHLMLFFLSWIILTSASSYFVLTGTSFWSEKLDAKRPISIFEKSSNQVRFSRSVVGDLFANPDYTGDFENLQEEPLTGKIKSVPLKRIHIRRLPIRSHKHIEIPMRPLAEVTFAGTVDTHQDGSDFATKADSDKHQQDDSATEAHSDELEDEEEQESKRFTLSTFVKPSLAPNDYEETLEEDDRSLILTGHTMEIEDVELMTTPSNSDEYSTETTEAEIETTISPKNDSQEIASTTTTKSTSTEETPTTVPSTTTTKGIEMTWHRVVTTTTKTKGKNYEQIIPLENIYEDTTMIPKPLEFHSLHSRLVIFLCRLAFCLIAILLAFVILPSFFFVIAGTGCYIYSEHPMNRSTTSNRIGRIVSIYSTILLFSSAPILIFSTFALFYTHCHELLCASIQLQNQRNLGVIEVTQEKLMEAYSVNSSQCSRSLAPVQSLLLSSLLVCISILPCVFSMFKLVKYFYRMSSEFYWNAGDNYAGRKFSKQSDFSRFQTTAIYPDDDMQPTYGVYGQI